MEYKIKVKFDDIHSTLDKLVNLKNLIKVYL